MHKLIKKSRWFLGGLGAYALAFGGCLSDPQATDFLRTEFSRITGDVAAQLFLMFIQSISPISGAGV
ncbi:MAG: hypothetical protein JXQ75_02175 [Phycisphaerae bacterium]|nr:hypothetical protein [Phycisphaerae bacterium]